MDSNKKEISELRQDPVSKDWIIVSTGRSKRPSAYKSSSSAGEATPIALCPFEDPKKYGNEIVKSFYKKGEREWFVHVIKNKFPIAHGDDCGLGNRHGPYSVKTEASGHHEIVVTRYHSKTMAQMTNEEVGLVIAAYKSRYDVLEVRECVKYILIFHNHGRDAGASISHPHSQILAIPYIPADIRRSLEGAASYHSQKPRCVHCDILDWELKEKKRIVFENENFVALVPYVPKFSYEIRIFPKKHQPYFEKDPDNLDLAEALRVSLAKISKGLNDVAYNFFIHTPPADRNNEYDYYHWHLEINPRVNTWGGFELGTGGDVIDVDPDETAEYLRNIKV